MNIVIYARFSSSSQREASIEEQVKICREYAERNNYNVVKVYSDSAISGKTDNRPALKKVAVRQFKTEIQCGYSLFH